MVGILWYLVSSGFGILWFLRQLGILRCRIRRYNPVFLSRKDAPIYVAGPCGAGDVSGGTAGEKVSGSVECCSPVAAAAAGSTRTWA